MGERGNGQAWTGALLVLVGLWIVLRTVRQDSNGYTLVDHILGTANKHSRP